MKTAPAESRPAAAPARRTTQEPYLARTARGACDAFIDAGAVPARQPPHMPGAQRGPDPVLDSLDFVLPPELEAAEPPEARGLQRDEVRLMVSYRATDRVRHVRFREIGRFLTPGDLLVVNTSGTMNAALAVEREDGMRLEMHLSTRLPGGAWSVELRIPRAAGTEPFLTAAAGEQLCLPGGGTATLTAPYPRHRPADRGVRLWRARLLLPMPMERYLAEYGFPIRYGYVRDPWPSPFYQTVFATDRGSAEMLSAGRAFTTELVTGLVAAGIQFAPLVLHTGVASLEDHEPPYAEWYRVPRETAERVNATRRAGGRILAVGTTVVRARETVTGPDGFTRPGQGRTDLVITPARGIHAVDGLLTGLHEPRASHLAILEALADRVHLRAAYDQSLRRRYLWHEFGDLHLLLP